MNRHLVPSLIGALSLSASAFAAAPAAKPAPAAAAKPAGEPHAPLALQSGAKLMLVKGPAHVGTVVSVGTGSAQIFEVATPNASNAGCVANPVPGTTPVTLANASTQDLKREVAAGHLLCATLTAGTAMTLTWYGHEHASGGNGVTATPTEPKMMVAGPVTIVHTSTGGDGQITIYAMTPNTGTDADCLAPAGKPGQAAAAGIPATGQVLKKLAARQSEKQNIVVPAGKIACAGVTGGAEGKVEWKTK